MRLRGGDTFGRYVVEQVIGEGGMGEVFRARDTRLRRLVALKVLRQEAGDDDDIRGQAVARMLREARAAAALSHPNAVAIYDIGEHEGAPFLAMELVEGAPLRRFVGEGAPVETRLGWLLDVARALAAAHRAGLVHRDVKPENVMIRDDGVVKVLDFGIARPIRLASAEGALAEDAQATVTGPGVLVGTPAYMAPEQLRGDPLDGRSDQFSWGVMAYEVLAGRLPFGAGRGAIAVLAAVVGEAPQPLEGVPEEVADIVARALAKSREARFASMDDLCAALEPLVARDAAPGSRRGDAGPASRRGAAQAGHRTPASTPGDGKAATISAVQAPAQGPRTGRRRARWPLAAAALAVLCAGAAAAAARWATPPPDGHAAPAPQGRVADAPTAVTDLEAPRTQSPAALAAYRDGLQAFRDARWDAAHHAFEEAVALDPSFAAAYLRLADTSHNLSLPVVETRARFQRALALRASLGERDRALLDAFEPLLLREPPDPAETVRRLEEASARYPGDAELLAQQIAIMKWRDMGATLELTDRCLALDPEYADCWQIRAMALRTLGRRQEALASYDRCLEVSPAATDCLRDRAQVHAQEGRCDRFEQDARRMIGQPPDVFESYADLASALYALGRPQEAVRAALEQGFAKLPAEDAAAARQIQEGHLAILTGDLRAAERAFRDAMAARAEAPDEPTRARPLLSRMTTLQELGEEREAARLADRFLVEREALLKTSGFTIMADATMFLHDAKLRGGLLDRAAYEAAREAWLRSWEGKLPDGQRSVAWVQAYARRARTPEQAREALERLPDYGSPPQVHTSPEIQATMGRLYLLAGRPAEALPLLADATRACNALTWSLGHTVATYQLGLAREATGDAAGACAAYGVVLGRWPERSGSVTARAAAARVKALRCAAAG